MGTAVVVALVTSIVAALGVLANALTSVLTVREETKRTRESREAEDRRLREDREAEAQRRDGEAAAAAARAEQADRDARVQQRWEAVRTAIETEAKLRDDPLRWSNIYRLKLQGLSLLTHPDEANLRAALTQRAQMAHQPAAFVQTQVRPEWWHPWISEWAAKPQEAMVYGEADEGKVF